MYNIVSYHLIGITCRWCRFYISW